MKTFCEFQRIIAWIFFTVYRTTERMESETIRIEKLNDASQFPSWKFQVRVTLNANEIFGVVSGSEAKPTPAAADATATVVAETNKRIAEWNKKDARAQRIIATTITQKLIVHIMNCETAKAMWDKLHAVFEQNSDISKQHLQEKFFNFQKDPADDMATHFSKMESLVQQMKSMNVAIDDSMVMTRIITTLPQEYKHFASAWESTGENLRTLANLNNRLLIEESRMKAHGIGVGGTEALLVRSNKSKPKNSQKKRKGRCFNCGSTEYWKKDCKVSKTSKDSKTSSKSTENENSKAFFCELTVSKNKDEMWFSESGATHHMSKIRAWFRDYIEFDTPHGITLGNGDVVYALSQGNFDILANNGTRWIEKTLTKVLFVPDVYANMFSMTKVLDNGHTSESTKNEVKILDGESVVAVGVRRGGLFQMVFRTIESTNESMANIAIKR